MLRFNISRRFRSGSTARIASPGQKPAASKKHIDKLHAIDDSVLTYLAESIVRELAEKGTLTSQFRQQLHIRAATITANESELPLVSVGPSGIRGCYQAEL